MTHDLIHIESTPGTQCIIRLSSISFAKWEDEQLLLFIVGDSDPVLISGEQAQKLWIFLYNSSLSIGKEKPPYQPGVHCNP